MRGKIVMDRGVFRYFINGQEVTKRKFDRTFKKKPLGSLGACQTPTCWPMASDAAAVHPGQIEEAMADARKRGVPTDFDREGRPIFTDRGHRKAYLRAYGFHDNSGGYGD